MGISRSLALAALAAGIAGAPQSAIAQSEDAAALRKSCTKGEALACANLAVLYKHGRNVDQSYPEALTLFVRACENGMNLACGQVGEMTYRGYGVAANQEDGAAILHGACRRGDGWSCETMRRLGLKIPKKNAG
jgi:TPR repeat protein